MSGPDGADVRATTRRMDTVDVHHRRLPADAAEPRRRARQDPGPAERCGDPVQPDLRGDRGGRHHEGGTTGATDRGEPRGRDFTGAPAGPLAERQDDAALRTAIRATTQHLYRPVGTVRIGTAVDAELRGHGVDGLRVADVSVMPTITRGNTQAPAYMIGEKAADMVRGRRPAQRRTVPVRREDAAGAAVAVTA